MGVFFQHAENLQVALWQQAPTSLAVLGYPWVSCLGELLGVRVLQGAAWDNELGLEMGCIKLHFNLGLN